MWRSGGQATDRRDRSVIHGGSTDPIELLKAIKVLMHETARARYPLASLTDAFTRLINLRQMEHENLLDYVDNDYKMMIHV